MIAMLPNFGQRVTARRRAPIDHEISIDGFAGVGGWGRGEEAATGWAIDVAFNHDPLACSAYRINHPATTILQTDAFEIDPRKVEPERPVGHCHFSPDCTHHSKARGAAPVSDRVRGLAWVVLAWIVHRRPRVITLENVEEFRKWGPTIDRKGQRYPDPERVGETFAVFIGALAGGVQHVEPDVLAEIERTIGHLVHDIPGMLRRGLSYEIEHLELRACDYGAPTTRKRFFMIARSDGDGIIWPEKTHAIHDSTRWSHHQRAADNPDCSRSGRNARSYDPPDGREALEIHGCRGDGVHEGTRDQQQVHSSRRSGRGNEALAPFRTAAECIDWSIPCPSIFLTPEQAIAWGKVNGWTPRRPLAQKTLERIAAGVMRYVINCGDPFIVTITHGVDRFRGQGIHEPLRTITTAHRGESALVTPIVVGPGGQRFEPFSAVDPLNTILTKPNQAIVAPILASYHHAKGSESRCRDLREPMATLDTENRQAVIAPVLVPRNGEREGQEPRARSVEQPMPTIVPSGNGAALLTKHYGGVVGQRIDEPAPTITSTDHNALTAAHLVKLRGTCKDGQDLREPMPALTAGGTHVGVIAAFLQTYYGNSREATTIAGEPYIIVDICMRMLQPHELLRAQFGEFAEGWVLSGTKTQQVAGIGNSVCPHVARAIVAANYQPRIVRPQTREAAVA